MTDLLFILAMLVLTVGTGWFLYYVWQAGKEKQRLQQKYIDDFNARIDEAIAICEADAAKCQAWLAEDEARTKGEP